MKRYTQAPLTFQGQKRWFLRQIEAVAARQPRGTVFGDRFGDRFGDGTEVHHHHVGASVLDHDDIMRYQGKPTRGIDSV